MVTALRGHREAVVQFNPDPTGMSECCITIAPFATSCEERTKIVEELVNDLVKEGIVKASSIRNEMQDVHRYGTMSPQKQPLFKVKRK